MKILAIDPALANTGWCIFDSEAKLVLQIGIIQTKPKSKMIDRARHIFSELSAVLTAHKPELIVFEMPHGSQSAQAAIGQGVIIGLIAMLPDAEHVTPSQVKKVTGIKNADKNQMIAWAKTKTRLLDNVPKCRANHIADSIAVAYAYLDPTK